MNNKWTSSKGTSTRYASKPKGTESN